jgi:hypothetical protein
MVSIGSRVGDAVDLNDAACHRQVKHLRENPRPGPPPSLCNIIFL